MIEFNVTPSRVAGHSSGENLRTRTSRWWTCADAKLREYGDFAIAVEANVVAGIFPIRDWFPDSANGGKKVLVLDPLPSEHPLRRLIGGPAPIPWLPGQRQPFKYVVRADISGVTGAELRSYWNRRDDQMQHGPIESRNLEGGAVRLIPSELDARVGQLLDRLTATRRELADIKDDYARLNSGDLAVDELGASIPAAEVLEAARAGLRDIDRALGLSVDAVYAAMRYTSRLYDDRQGVE